MLAVQWDCGRGYNMRRWNLPINEGYTPYFSVIHSCCEISFSPFYFLFYDCSCLCKFISYCFMYQLLSDAESVRWLNYAINKMWPVCMEKIVSQLLRPIIPWFLDKFKPWTVVWFPSFILIFWFIFSILWHFTSNCFFNNVFLWQSHFSFVK